jgi:hypothetical protein
MGYLNWPDAFAIVLTPAVVLYGFFKLLQQADKTFDAPAPQRKLPDVKPLWTSAAEYVAAAQKPPAKKAAAKKAKVPRG